MEKPHLSRTAGIGPALPSDTGFRQRIFPRPSGNPSAARRVSSEERGEIVTISDSNDGDGEGRGEFVVMRLQADGRVARNGPALVRRLCREMRASVVALVNLPDQFAQILQSEGPLAGFQVVLPRTNPFAGAGAAGGFGLLVRPQIVRTRSFDLAVPPAPERPGLDMVIRAGGRDMRLLLAELPWQDLVMGMGRRRLRGVVDRGPILPTLVIGTVPTALYLSWMTKLGLSIGKLEGRRRLTELHGLGLRYAAVGINNLRMRAAPDGNLCTAEVLSAGRVARFRIDGLR